jgi:plastocyanin
MFSRIAALSLAVVLAACGGSSGGSSTPPPTSPGTGTPGLTNPTVTTSVAIQNTAFNPTDIQVVPSAVVTFTNNDNIAHNVTFSNSAIASVPNFNSGSRTVAMPATAGTYTYSCTIHSGMTGSVLVK